MFKVTYTCDGCGAVRGEANHWFGVRVMSGGPALIYSSLTIVAFNDSHSSDDHYCGESCVSKRVAAFMEKIRQDCINYASEDVSA